MDEAKTTDAPPHVAAFRQILLWPLQLLPSDPAAAIVPWEILRRDGSGRWIELEDEYPTDPARYQERHYREFVAFLPHVRRFLYGERTGRAGRAGYGESPIRVFRRTDVAAARLTVRPGEAPIVVEVVHADLYFFFDVDVVILVVEIAGADLTLARTQDVVYRFGRAYPAGWEADGAAANCLHRVEWLDGDGAVLATSDYGARAKFMASVCRHQTTAISAHWEHLLAPMVLDQTAGSGTTRYRQLEFHRMPLMVWLALDDASRLDRAAAVRLAFATAPGPAGRLPWSRAFLDDFETRYAYDRFHDPERDEGWTDTRILCTGQAFVAIGDASRPLFTDPERGFLGQFRHQLFLIGLIAHFHRASLLMLADRLVTTMNRLDPRRRESVGVFRRDIRLTLETFLRFTHRYYFSEISDQLVIRELFRLWSGHLGTGRLYQELRDEIGDMASYLETDLLRRQAVTILQLTVVTLFSQIGMLATGFLGMNIFGWAEAETPTKIMIFFAVLIPSALITLYTVLKARRLAQFLDTLANERVGWKGKLSALFQVWRK